MNRTAGVFSNLTFVAFTVLILQFFLAFVGCDHPQRDPVEYGKIIDTLPDVPEAKEQFKLPEVEGVDTEFLMRSRNR